MTQNTTFHINCLPLHLAQSINSGAHLVIAPTREIAAIKQTIQTFHPTRDVLLLPEWDYSIADELSPSAECFSARMNVLSTLLRSSQDSIIISSPKAVQQKLLSKEFLSQHIQCTIDKDISFSTLPNQLVALGYERKDVASISGEFAVRGGIVDIVTPATSPVRLEFFGDTLESITPYDPFSQQRIKETKPITELIIPIAREVFLTPQFIQHIQKNISIKSANIHKEPFYEELSAGIVPEGFEHFLSFFSNQLVSFFELLSPNFNIHMTHWEEETQNNLELEKYPDSFIEANSASHVTKEELPTHVKAYETDNALEGWLPPFLDNKDRFTFAEYMHRLKDLVTKESSSKPVIITFSSTADQQHLKGALQTMGLTYKETPPQKALNEKNGVFIAAGYIAPFHTKDHLILNTAHFKEKTKKHISSKQPTSLDQLLFQAQSLQKGDLVVHKLHGIGKFERLVAVETGSHTHDCMKLLYQNDDVLYVPVENLDLITRFGSSHEGVALDKLGSVRWTERRKKAKERIAQMAEKLVKMAAQRKLSRIPSIDPSHELYEKFANQFPYVETDDQLQSITDIEQDLASGKVMDRLICGDVGFGKTEIAMRAAFLVAQQGGQVIVMAPTTLLVQQHIESFRDRFKDFNIRIEGINRFTSPKNKKTILHDTQEGKVAILIGTHALLNDSIKYKNARLLIIDEEHRFGVRQKEKLKKLKTGLHILSLSATPIPRTLQMSMTGVREMSVIATPPINRLPIKTTITSFSPKHIAEAIRKEVAREGRVFFVTPRLKFIPEILDYFQKYLNDIPVVVAHGQMEAKELEDALLNFKSGQYKVLISTHIIESGIDISSANTMVIYNAQLFGLSELYQLRGRIGRADQQAYAYLTYPSHKKLLDTASKRLSVMQSLDTLGAGFQIASHDMDIRGYGNLLGEEQSGHIKEVGVELFQQMLEDAIRRFKQHTKSPEEDTFSPTLNLNTSVGLPENYISTTNLRMSTYRRLANIKTQEELDKEHASLEDRFGPMPEPAKMLFKTLSIKLLCVKAGVEKIDVGPKGILLQFYNNAFHAPEKLIPFLQNNPFGLKLRPDHKLFLPTAKKHTPVQLVEHVLSSLLSL